MITPYKTKPGDVALADAYVAHLRQQPDGSRYLAHAEKRLAELQASVCDQRCLVCDEYMVVCVPNEQVRRDSAAPERKP